MLAARLVVIRKDVDVFVLEPLVQIGRPLPGSLRVGGGNKSKLGETVSVLLALDNEDLVVNGLQHLRKTVGYLGPDRLAPFPARSGPMVLGKTAFLWLKAVDPKIG